MRNLRLRRPSRSGIRAPFFRKLALVAAACLLVASARGAEPPAASPASPILLLTNGGFLPGSLRDSERPATIRWQGTSFVAPFDFELKAVNALHYPAPAVLPRPVGDYCFDLAGGDVLFGSLVDLDDDEATLDIPRFGRLHVKRAALHRIDRWRDSADMVYLGPSGLTGWRTSSTGDVKGWREESGELVSERDGTALFGDLGLPAQAAVEFEISWKSKPDFVLSLGVTDDEQVVARAFRFEVWGDDLVVQRETDTTADVASVGALSSGPGRAHLKAYLDQERGRILVFSANSEPLADLKIADRKSSPLAGVRLENKHGDVRLERIRVTRWNGKAPSEARADRSSIHLANGSTTFGMVVKYDAPSKEFVVRDDENETRVPEDQVTSLLLSPPGFVPPRSARAVFQDGARLSGELNRVENGELLMSVPDVKEVARLPVAGLRSLVALHDKFEPLDRARSTVRLEMEGVRLPGRLVDGQERPDASCLVWQPLGSDTASPLRPGVAGRIVYKEPPPPPSSPLPTRGVDVRIRRPAPVPQPPAQPAGGMGGFVRAFAANQPPQRTLTRRSMYLRTGDIIPSDVVKIDENGVTFRTPLSQGTFVPHEKVKAVELASVSAAMIRLNKSKRERLLTLPRMQKGSPPTHLIRSTNGDYLRGRVIEMDDKTLQVEVRLETKKVPRDRVAQIIWLHPDELEPDRTAANPPVAPRNEATRVQAVRSDSTRLTFFAERLADATLSGKGDVLGPCQVRLDEVDQLLLGGSIEREASQLAYQRWKLQNAPEPIIAQSDGGSSGTESALVGKPAPDFELVLLDGKTFHLADTKGKVVVLDFWATWCGPCLQTMPQVERVAQEFQDKGVLLVAVNLQETPKEISAMLERHKLKMAVALDSDGVVADRYNATAIPQTVIINRDGTVSRLYVGGGPRFDEQLREALQGLMPGGDPKEPSK